MKKITFENFRINYQIVQFLASSVVLVDFLFFKFSLPIYSPREKVGAYNNPNHILSTINVLPANPVKYYCY